MQLLAQCVMLAMNRVSMTIRGRCENRKPTTVFSENNTTWCATYEFLLLPIRKLKKTQQQKLEGLVCRTGHINVLVWMFSPYTVRLLTHVLCKPTHFFFHSFIATMPYSLQTSFNSLMKDWADKYHVWGTPTWSPSRSNSR